MSAEIEIGPHVVTVEELTAEAIVAINNGYRAGADGEPMPDGEDGPFMVGWLAGAHGEGFISNAEAERILRERAEPCGDQVKG